MVLRPVVPALSEPVGGAPCTNSNPEVRCGGEGHLAGALNRRTEDLSMLRASRCTGLWASSTLHRPNWQL